MRPAEGFTDLTVEDPLLTDPSALPGPNPSETTHPPFHIVTGVKQ